MSSSIRAEDVGCGRATPANNQCMGHAQRGTSKRQLVYSALWDSTVVV